MTSKRIQVLEIKEEPDGSAILTLEVSSEFKDWFKKEHGLKRFSKKKFDGWFLKILKEKFNDKEMQTTPQS